MEWGRGGCGVQMWGAYVWGGVFGVQIGWRVAGGLQMSDEVGLESGEAGGGAVVDTWTWTWTVLYSIQYPVEALNGSEIR